MLRRTLNGKIQRLKVPTNTIGKTLKNTSSINPNTMKQNIYPTRSIKKCTNILNIDQGIRLYSTDKQRFINENSNRLPKVIVLGNGWGSTAFLYRINTDKYNVTLISPRDHMLYTPLLASSAVGTLESRDIVYPIRPLATKKNIKFYQSTAIGLDHENKMVIAKPCHEDVLNTANNDTINIPYDYLIVGIGAEPATFGIPGVNENVFFLKEAIDGYRIRTRLHDLFEAASLPIRQDPNKSIVEQQQEYEKERQRQLTLIIVGGGPTGVEFAGELADYVNDMKKLYPNLSHLVKLKLIASSDSIISNFEKKSQQVALDRQKNHFNYDVQLSMKVERIEKNLVVTEKESIPCGIIVWSTGIAARKFLRESGLELTPQKHAIAVDDHLRVLNGNGFIFALGDACTITLPTPSPLPPIAQVAEQQGIYLSKLFNNDRIRRVSKSPILSKEYTPWRKEILENTSCDIDEIKKNPPKITTYPFHYFTNGMLAYIGKRKAIAHIMFISKIFGSYLPNYSTTTLAYTNDPSRPVVLVKKPLHVVNDKYGIIFRNILGFFTWRSAYIYKMHTFRGMISVLFDWLRVAFAGKDNSSIH